MKDKIWKLVNSNIFSNTSAAIIGSVVTWQFSRAYREGDLRSLKEDLAQSDFDRVQLNQEVRELERVNRHLLSELAIKQSQLYDCRSNFRDSYCFWRQNTRDNYTSTEKDNTHSMKK